MEALGGRAQRALDAICDTFVPAQDGLPSATALGVPAAVLGAVAMNPRRSERKQVAQLLSLWDTALLTAVGGGGLHRFSSLSPEKREQVLLSWCDSRSPQRRAAFQALRKGALLMYYVLPGPNGEPNPVWDRMDYPGPLGRPDNPPPRALEPLAVERDTEIDCDVVVVGSGAGGGTAAGVLAQAGLDVVVLEAGDYYDDADFDGGEFSGLSRMYLYGGGAATHDQSVGLLAGSCLGGGTTINYTTSFRTPDDVREEWASHGVPAFASDQYAQSLDAVCERLGVNQEHNRPSQREQVMHQGLVALGWHSDIMPRNVRGCEQGKECGYCGYGCRLRSEAVDGEDLACRRSAGGRPHPRPHASRSRRGGAGPRHRRRGTHAGRARGQGAIASRDLGLWGASHSGAATALGPHQPQHRHPPAPASGHGRLGHLRRGDPSLGGHHAGRLLGPAPLPRWRLWRQVRDGRSSPHAAGVVRSLAQRAPARRDDAVALPHDRDRSAAA